MKKTCLLFTDRPALSTCPKFTKPTLQKLTFGVCSQDPLFSRLFSVRLPDIILSDFLRNCLISVPFEKLKLTFFEQSLPNKIQICCVNYQRSMRNHWYLAFLKFSLQLAEHYWGGRRSSYPIALYWYQYFQIWMQTWQKHFKVQPFFLLLDKENAH